MSQTTEDLIADYLARGKRIKRVKPGRRGIVTQRHKPRPSSTTWHVPEEADKSKKIDLGFYEPRPRNSFFGW